MNRVMLIGNLTRDPDARMTVSGVACTTFTLAVNRRYASADGNREADYFNIVTWRQTAEACARYLGKGKKCAVSGQLQNRSYEAKDGTKRYVTEVIADEVMFLSAKPETASAAPVSAKTEQTRIDPNDYYPDDELPF